MICQMLDKSTPCFWGSSWRTYPFKLSSDWGIDISKFGWDKMSQHLLLLRTIKLSSIQTKSEI